MKGNRYVRPALGAALALAMASAACSLLDDLDDIRLYGGSGASDASDAHDNDVPDVDGSGSDPDATEAAVAFCSTKPFASFCSDFEDGGLPGPWTSTLVTGGGTVTDESATSVSASRSLLTTTPGTASAACVLKQGVSAAATTLSVDFDLLIEQVGAASLDIFNLYASVSHNLGVEIAPNGAVGFDEDIPVVDGGPSQVLTATTGRIALKTWMHVRETVERAASIATAKLYIGGTLVGTYVASDATFASSLELELGDCSIPDGSGPWRVRFDNFVFETK